MVAWPYSLKTMVSIVEELIDRLLLEPSQTGRSGGFLVVALNRYVIHHSLYGTVPDGKIERYRELAYEKVLRLDANREMGHVCSYQSRNPGKDQFGGSIVAGQFTVGFSGLTEGGDSALSLGLVSRLGGLSEDACGKVARIANCFDLFCWVTQTNNHQATYNDEHNCNDD